MEVSTTYLLAIINKSSNGLHTLLSLLESRKVKFKVCVVVICFRPLPLSIWPYNINNFGRLCIDWVRNKNYSQRWRGLELTDLRGQIAERYFSQMVSRNGINKRLGWGPADSSLNILIPTRTNESRTTVEHFEQEFSTLNQPKLPFFACTCPYFYTVVRLAYFTSVSAFLFHSDARLVLDWVGGFTFGFGFKFWLWVW